jgi:ElaB/YqjD/DUF883 family membrane-anchored ribosome-binding protein
MYGAVRDVSVRRNTMADVTQERRAPLSGDGNSDAEVLRHWLDHLAQFISSLDEIEGDDDPFDFIENAMEAYQGGVSPDTAPSPTSPAMLIIVETLRTLAQAMNSATGDFYETPDARDRVTRAVAQQSLARALEGVRQEGESWLTEVMPTAEQVRQRIALTGATFTAALDAGAQQMAEMDKEDAEAEADPYGAILLHSDPSRSDAPIFEKVCSFTEAENKRYADAHRALEKMLEGDLYLHVSDECDRLCDVLAEMMRESGKLSVTNTDAVEEMRRKLRSALISFTNALQIHEEQTIKRAEETFGRYARETRIIRKLFSDLKKSSFDYRWLRVQGDVLQHVDINAFKYGLTASLHGEPEVTVDTDREALLEFTKRSWNQPWLNRNELQAMDSDPSVLKMIEKIQPLMREMHAKITKVLYPNVARDVAIVKELIGRFEGRRGMYAMSTGPGFTRRKRTLQFSPLATHVLAFADNYEAS